MHHRPTANLRGSIWPGMPYLTEYSRRALLYYLLSLPLTLSRSPFSPILPFTFSLLQFLSPFFPLTLPPYPPYPLPYGTVTGTCQTAGVMNSKVSTVRTNTSTFPPFTLSSRSLFPLINSSPLSLFLSALPPIHLTLSLPLPLLLSFPHSHTSTPNMCTYVRTFFLILVEIYIAAVLITFSNQGGVTQTVIRRNP
jgi:hypothetical protein